MWHEVVAAAAAKAATTSSSRFSEADAGILESVANHTLRFRALKAAFELQRRRCRSSRQRQHSIVPSSARIKIDLRNSGFCVFALDPFECVLLVLIFRVQSTHSCFLFTPSRLLHESLFPTVAEHICSRSTKTLREACLPPTTRLTLSSHPPGSLVKASKCMKSDS